MNTRVPINFEIPTIYWPNEHDTHYAPPRTADPAVAEARRLLPGGTLVLANQLHGIRIASLMLGKLTAQKDVAFAGDVLAGAAFGSAGYMYGIGSDTMRRNLALPVQIDPETGERATDFDRSLASRERLIGALITSNLAVREKVKTHKISKSTAMLAGRAAASAALHISLLPYVGLADTGSRREVQQNVRDIGMDALVSAKQLARAIGTYPTLAQLTDPYSDVVVHLHRSGSPAVAAAWHHAVDEANALAAT